MQEDATIRNAYVTANYVDEGKKVMDAPGLGVRTRNGIRAIHEVLMVVDEAKRAMQMLIRCEPPIRSKALIASFEEQGLRQAQINTFPNDRGVTIRLATSFMFKSITANVRAIAFKNGEPQRVVVPPPQPIAEDVGGGGGGAKDGSADVCGAKGACAVEDQNDGAAPVEAPLYVPSFDVEAKLNEVDEHVLGVGAAVTKLAEQQKEAEDAQRETLDTVGADVRQLCRGVNAVDDKVDQLVEWQRKERELADREARIDVREQNVHVREKKCNAMRSRLGGLAAQASHAARVERDAALELLASEKEHCKSLKTVVAEKNAEIAGLKAALAEKDLRIAEKSADVERLMGTVAEKNLDVGRLMGMVAEKDRLIAERNEKRQKLAKTERKNA